MAFDRFLIAPINSGLVNNSKSWLQPDDAFELMENAYVFRGRVRKRFGSQLMGTTPLSSRLRTSLAAGGAGVGITGGGGVATGNVRTILGDAASPALPLNKGMSFSVGTQVFTVISSTAGVQPMLPLATGSTFNITTGDYVINTSPIVAATTVYFYPSLPVMGIDQYLVDKVNNHPTYAFDERYVYSFSGGAWDRSGTAIWHGDNTDYFWVSNWQGAAAVPTLFVSNFNFTVGNPATTDDPIWSFDNTTWTAAIGNNAFYFRPTGQAPFGGPYVKTARLIVAFKNRLILLNTVENNNPNHDGTAGTNTNFVSRARYCFYGSPFAVNAWYEKSQSDTSGNAGAGGGFVDAATEEQIISAEFIKDRLIVYFERSTWELVYTQNQVFPFVWQKINTELGSQSTFSIVPFDKDVLTIGQSGIHACNAQNVIRIDDKIPDRVFEFETKNNGPIRTCGIRDYFTEMVYWSYVSNDAQTNQEFPNRVLVYNYKLGSWAINDDCFTTFGYFEQQSDLTWESSAPVIWSNFNGTWISNVNAANQRQILGGTPEGFIIKLNVEETRNAPSMSITDMSFDGTGIVTLTIIDHNLSADPTDLDYDEDFILIENVVADTATQAFLNGSIFNVDSVRAAGVIDPDKITINTNGGLLSGTYSGGGTSARVSNIQIITKNYNPYVDQNRSVYVAKVDFAVEKTGVLPLTPGGELTIDYYTSTAPISMLEEGLNSGSIMGNNILQTSAYDPSLYPLEQYQELLWHPIYFQSSGEFIQLVMYMSLTQMLTPKIALAPFEMEAMVLYTQPTSQRMQ